MPAFEVCVTAIFRRRPFGVHQSHQRLKHLKSNPTFTEFCKEPNRETHGRQQKQGEIVNEASHPSFHCRHIWETQKFSFFFYSNMFLEPQCAGWGSRIETKKQSWHWMTTLTWQWLTNNCTTGSSNQSYWTDTHYNLRFNLFPGETGIFSNDAMHKKKQKNTVSSVSNLDYNRSKCCKSRFPNPLCPLNSAPVKIKIYIKTRFVHNQH